MLNLLKTARISQQIYLTTCHRHYAKAAPVAATTVKSLGKKLGKLGPVVEKKIMPVETDPVKLVNECCCNYFVEGGHIQLKPDNEYPDWLWKLHTGPPKKLEELDPNTKAYWRKLRTMALRRNLTLIKVKKF